MNEAEARVSAVLFDMDGVLIDSRSVIERAWREAAQIFGRHISDEEIHTHIHGQPGPDTIRALFSDLPRSDQERVQAHVIHVENTADYDPIAGVAKLITLFHQAGVTIGIVTSGWHYKIDRVIELLNARSYFSVIVQRDDVSRGKPYPAPYLLAAERLGVTASKTLVFEDAISGVTSAVMAGAYRVGIGGEELVRHGAKIAMPDFTRRIGRRRSQGVRDAHVPAWTRSVHRTPVCPFRTLIAVSTQSGEMEGRGAGPASLV